MKLRLLDPFCGAGGAARGYQLAGFEVVGVDIVDQPRYAGDEFIQADALEYIAYHGHEFDAIHASPPCQRSSAMTNCRPGLAATYPNLIRPTRYILERVGKPFVIENVVGSDVRPDLTLCGQMFGLPLYRHRLFELGGGFSIPWHPHHPKHTIPASRAGHWRPGTIMSVSGHVSPIAEAKRAMGGIDWMTREELAEAIPPQYTRFIGDALLEHLTAVAA